MRLPGLIIIIREPLFYFFTAQQFAPNLLKSIAVRPPKTLPVTKKIGLRSIIYNQDFDLCMPST